METLTPIQPSPTGKETSHAAIIHLSALSSYIGVPFGSVLGPLITWLIWRDESTFVDQNGKEALNFNLSLWLYQIAAVIIGLAFFLTPVLSALNTTDPNPFTIMFSIPGLWLFIGGIGLISLYRLIMVIVAAAKAGNGEIFHYPLTIQFIK